MNSKNSRKNQELAIVHNADEDKDFKVVDTTCDCCTIEENKDEETLDSDDIDYMNDRKEVFDDWIDQIRDEYESDRLALFDFLSNIDNDATGKQGKSIEKE